MRGLGDPESGLSYPELLRRGDDAAANALRGLLGAVTCVLLYTVLVPLVSFGLSAVGWLASGAPGEFAAYYAAGRAMEFPWGMVSAHLGLATLIVVGLGCVVAVNHLRPRWLCSVQPGFRWRYALLCLAACLVVLSATQWAQAGFPAWSGRLPDGFWAWFLVIALTAPLQAAGEEFLFRGYLLDSITLVARNKWAGVVLTAAVFAVFHGSQNFWLFCYRFGFGLVAGALVILTGGLEATIAAHVANNVVSFTWAATASSVSAVLATTEVSWQAAVATLLAFAVCGGLELLLARRLRLATLTP